MNTFEMTIKCNENNMEHFLNWGLYELRQLIYLDNVDYDYDEDITEVSGFMDKLNNQFVDFVEKASKECKARISLTCYDNYNNYITFDFRNGKKIA